MHHYADSCGIGFKSVRLTTPWARTSPVPRSPGRSELVQYSVRLADRAHRHRDGPAAGSAHKVGTSCHMSALHLENLPPSGVLHTWPSSLREGLRRSTPVPGRPRNQRCPVRAVGSNMLQMWTHITGVIARQQLTCTQADVAAMCMHWWTVRSGQVCSRRGHKLPARARGNSYSAC